MEEKAEREAADKDVKREPKTLMGLCCGFRLLYDFKLLSYVVLCYVM